MRKIIKKLWSKKEESPTIIEQLKQEIFQLREIVDNFPGDVYWKDRKGVWLGVNKRASESLKEMGFLSVPSKIIGKTDKEIFGEETAYIYRQNDFIVMDENREVSVEEETTLPSGERVIKSSTKKPLYNQKQEIVGIIGSSMDITAQKEAERLRLENTEQKVKIEEQEKFHKVANQLSHDMRSPLSALKLLYKQTAQKLTENERVMERNALTRFTDILNSGFVRYKSTNDDFNSASEEKESFMVSTALEQILAEKRLEYQNQCITFEMNFEASAVFAFFQVKLSAFKRMISNLINNAVDAFEDQAGEITVHLNVVNNQVIIIIEDNGKGMPESVKEKILNNMVVTSGKEHGNGIGFTQIRDTLQEHAGALSIDSTIGVGTKIQLIFAQTTSPAWAVDRIELNEEDLVVVVDDDPSIHGAWDTRFHSDVPNIRLKHFEQGKEAIEFINQLTPEEKHCTFLLTDYELLDQAVNGLDIVEQTQLTRTVLVTSHSDNETICERALSLKTRILPKLLASNILIGLKEMRLNEQAVSDVEIVIIDDDVMIRDTVAIVAFPNKKVAKYAEPEVFLDNISLYKNFYAKNTLFLIDHNFEKSSINGLMIAKKLHEQGYSHLYLFSGECVTSHEIPHYLTVIQKMDTEKLLELGALL